jgi:C-terminal processing protease CtpA/Prc
MWGCYVTKLATDANGKLPVYSEFEKSLKNFRSLSDNNDILKENGVYLKTEPAVPEFKGKVYLLTDHRTSKVAEALAILFKKEKIATLVGEESSGSSMLTQTIELDKQYQITIQVAQFLDREGKNYTNIGTVPDMIVNEGDALNFLLKKIN